ncbi:MAG: hypothetical protein R3B13_16460 [Polyangiaceae bacterium]
MRPARCTFPQHHARRPNGDGYVATNLRDRGIDHLDSLLAAHWKAPSLLKLQIELQRLTPTQRDLVRRAFGSSMDAAIHDFLFALQEQCDNEGSISVRVGRHNVAKLSDGLQGEMFSADGWFARFSAHGEPPEEA